MQIILRLMLALALVAAVQARLADRVVPEAISLPAEDLITEQEFTNEQSTTDATRGVRPQTQNTNRWQPWNKRSPNRGEIGALLASKQGGTIFCCLSSCSCDSVASLLLLATGEPTVAETSAAPSLTNLLRRFGTLGVSASSLLCLYRSLILSCPA